MSTDERHHAPILVAEDDPDDRLLAADALEENGIVEGVRFVEDGEELLQYLRHEGPYAAPASAPRPGLVLLDLNMPRKDGREALREIKADERLRTIPIVVLTTSKAEDDVASTYDLGGGGFVTKPVTFEGLVAAIGTVTRYWLDVSRSPAPDPRGATGG